MTAPAEQAAAPVVTGPLCDICGQEAAAVSLMFLETYATVRFGLDCAPVFLAQQLATVAGDMAADLAAAAAAAPGDTETAADVPVTDLPHAVLVAPDGQAYDVTGPLPADATIQDVIAVAEGSPPDDWPMVTTVRKSTHGHRKPKADTP